MRPIYAKGRAQHAFLSSQAFNLARRTKLPAVITGDTVAGSKLSSTRWRQWYLNDEAQGTPSDIFMIPADNVGSTIRQDNSNEIEVTAE